MYVIRSVSVTLLLALTACTQHSMNTASNRAAAADLKNPLFQKSTLPYQLPPFDRIEDRHIAAALEAGMAQQRREIDSIAQDPAPPTFENTIVAMERSGELLGRASSVFGNLTASHSNPTLEKIETEMAPKLAAHTDSIYLDALLYARVSTLYGQRDSLPLDAESKRLLARYHVLFVRAGARLSDDDKARLRQMNEQLSTLTTQFRQAVLKQVNASAVIVADAAELAGLSAEQMAVAAEAAKTRGLTGKWVIPLLNTTGQPSLADLGNRALRERIYQASVNRGWGGDNDTTALIAQIVKLRAERAALLGYPTHAAYILEDETAGTPDAVNKMLGQLAPPALANAKKEAAAMQQLIDAQARANGTQPFPLAAWDWDFYAEQVRRASYAYDESEVRPYLEMDRVLRDGVLFAAQELYGLKFTQRKDLPVYQQDVLVFEVSDADGSPLGLFLVDWYARENKRGGAWMNTFVDQSELLGKKSVVVNNLNIPKPPAGAATLLTFDEVTTAFHEFGHALHGLFSNVQYPQFSGTNVPRDFVEFPSQYNEMWATDPRVLANYARHYQTGEPMPQALIDKVLAARKFNQGFATTEYLAAAILDQAFHQLASGATPVASEVQAFEARALAQAGLDFAAVPPRYRSTYFSHVFADPSGYSSGYYAYIWSEVLARDTEHWFNTHGGLTRANGDLLRDRILSRGFSQDALVMFERFYGKAPEIGPLLEARGLNLPSVAAGAGSH